MPAALQHAGITGAECRALGKRTIFACSFHQVEKGENDGRIAVFPELEEANQRVLLAAGRLERSEGWTICTYLLN